MTVLIIQLYKQPKLVPELELDNFFKNNYPAIEVLSIDNHSEPFVWDFYFKALVDKNEVVIALIGEGVESESRVNAFLFKLTHKVESVSVFSTGVDFPDQPVFQNIVKCKNTAALKEIVSMKLSE